MKIKQVTVATSVLMLGLCTFFSSATNAQQPNKSMNDKKMMDGDMKQSSYVIPQKPEDISPLLNGENIPLVTLLDASGSSFDLNKAVAEKPTILIFYRGGWCPFCSKQLSGLQEIAPDLKKEGY